MSELRETVDLPALKTALAGAAARSRTLKAALRSPWREPMGTLQMELHRVQQRTTSLCILRAAMRGRFHLQKPMRAGAWPGMVWNQAEYHDKVVRRVAPEFALADEAGVSGGRSIVVEPRETR